MEQTKVEKRKKIIIISVIVLFSLIAIACLATIFLVNYNTFSPKAPQIVDDGENFYIIAQANDVYKGYEFKLKSLSDGKVIIIKDTSNKISTSDILKNGGSEGEYEASYRCLGKNSGNNSEYSKVTKFTLCVYLENPTFVYNEETKKIEWDEVEHADYYNIFYSGSEDFITVTGHSISIEQIPAGERTISILSYSNQPTIYKTSNVTKSQVVTIYHSLSNFTSATFNKSTKLITAKSKALYEKVKLQLGSKEIDFIISPNIYKEENGDYIYTFNIEGQYKDESSMTLIPYSLEYYIYEGNGFNVSIG